VLTIYGIPNCDSCRKARKFLAARGLEFKFHDIRKDGIDIQMLERWSGKVGWESLLNRKSLTWRQVPESDRQNMNRDRAMVLMLEEPTLIKRPVLESAEFTAVGFSEQRFNDFLARKA
jgi:arsenate reductase